eukprot:CAMPEP_0195303720 /NCGR_PEP_ID=MMETSP0707-20130614/33249_1 /TAXON_ID=33640 /ORGANISM="Asterionellopsis glacialis, Strain CCMP134" /LENGTH=609 /DNA_ID=CAMNT_0040367347 /DNA_START=239 /DNA_END=2068 /DNA_ORIENTATION=-
MAPSSIPGAGFGIFTAKTLEKDSIFIMNDGPNIAIPDPFEIPSPHLDLFGTVWWGENMGMVDQMRFEGRNVVDYQIGFGALPNFHPYLYNLYFDQPEIPYDDTILDRTLDPGAGASTYYAGKNFGVTRSVEAGDELFLNYGEGFLDSKPSFSYVPRQRDYEMAGNILAKFEELLVEVKALEENNKSLSSKVKGEIEARLTDIQNVASVFSERFHSILPKTYPELVRVMSGANSFDSVDLSDAVAKELSLDRRGLDWLKKNGLCLDNIIPGRSQIKQAGNGAFAQRSISNGETVVPVPLLHITNRDVLRMYEGAPDTKQLLLNYCFGHSESSLLLCPMTNAILVNHCSHRKKECGKEGPNAEYRWSTEWDSTTSEWINKSLKDLAEARDGRVVSLDIVATRDIKAGEEIFMDYGTTWEKAWDDYLSTWKAPVRDGVFEEHKSVKLLNEQEEPLELNPDLRSYSPMEEGGVFTGCWYWQDDEQDADYDGEEEDFDWMDLDDEEILSLYSRDGEHFRIHHYSDFGWFWPCSVVAKDDDSGSTYTVRIFQSKSHPQTAWSEQDAPRFLTNFPRSSIRFFTSLYKSDQHLPDAFRHHIEFRDDIFPEQWKNRRV